MRRLLRLLLVGLVVAIGLPLLSPARVDAQAMPDWHCDNSTPQLTLITCADEAAFVGVSTAVFAGSYLPLLTAMGTAAFVDFVTGGMDYDQCIGELPAPLEHRCAGLPGDDSPGKGWINKDPIDLPGEIMDGFCYVWPLISGCAPDPISEWWHSTGVEPVALGGISASSLRTVETAPNDTSWAAVIAGNLDEATFGDGEAHYVMCGVNTGRSCASTGSATGWKISVEVNELTETVTVVWRDEGSSPSTFGRSVPFEGWGQAMAIATRRSVAAPCTALGCPVSYLVGSEGDDSGWASWGGARCCSGSGTWSISSNTALSVSSTFPVIDTPTDLPDWGIMVWEGTVPDLLDLQAMVENLPMGDPMGAPEAPPAPPESPFPVPPAPPAVPVPWPDAPTAPAAPEVDPAPEPDQYEEVSEGTGEEGLFDRLANRIGSAINNVVNAIGSVAGWVVGILGELLEWLLEQIRKLFQWLGDLIQDLLLWIGDLLQWLGELLQDVIDALEQMTSLLGWWFQGLIDAIFNALGSLGDLLNASLQGLADLLSMLWDVLAEVPEFLGDILAGLLELPAMIWEYLTGGLPSLDMPDMPSCEGIFPCSWVAEGSSAIDEFGGLLNGAGACTPPALGWSEFSVSFPAPSGCTSGNPGMDSGVESQAGNLFGFRVPLRIFAAFGLWLAFFRLILASTPWGKVEDVPLNPVNAAQGYRSLS